jgi:hypothetical protein
MQLDEALRYVFDRVADLVRATAQELEPAALTWRPDPQGNTIAWLLWHLTRVQDDHLAEIAAREQVWSSQGWAQRFGLDPDAMDTGYGHSPDQVASVVLDAPQMLVDYHDRVVAATRQYLADAGPEDFGRVIDASYDPPVTVGVRLLSVTIDSLQHVGQATYVRGLWERRTSVPATAPGELDLAQLPEELRSRVHAATAHAEHRRIQLVPDVELPLYAVEAVSGDRLTLMQLSLDPDGSVAESTQTVTADEVVELHHGTEHVELVVGETDRRRRLLVSPAAVAALLPGPG